MFVLAQFIYLFVPLFLLPLQGHPSVHGVVGSSTNNNNNNNNNQKKKKVGRGLRSIVMGKEHKADLGQVHICFRPLCWTLQSPTIPSGFPVYSQDSQSILRIPSPFLTHSQFIPRGLGIQISARLCENFTECLQNNVVWGGVWTIIHHMTNMCAQPTEPQKNLLLLI